MKKIIVLLLFAVAAHAEPLKPPTISFMFADTSHFSTASPVVINWNANVESDLAGYKLYWDSNSSAPYANNVTVGNTTVYQKTFTAGLWFIALTAFDASGNESGYSNEVVFYVEAPSGSTVTDSLCVSWFRPTRWNSGAPLSAANILRYRVLAKLSSEPDWSAATVLDSVDASGAGNPVEWCDTINLADGTYDVAIRTVTIENSVQASGLISDAQTLIVPIVFSQRYAQKPIRLVISPKP
jgi:hypothetical protein